MNDLLASMIADGISTVQGWIDADCSTEDALVRYFDGTVAGPKVRDAVRAHFLRTPPEQRPTVAPITFDADGFVDGSITFTNDLVGAFCSASIFGRPDKSFAFVGIDDTHARMVRRGLAARRLTHTASLEGTCVGVGIGEYVDAACDAAERRVLARP